jgi:hypothetical protein
LPASTTPLPVAYLRAIFEADHDLDEMASAIEMAAPDSPAHAFARLHYSHAEAALRNTTREAGTGCGGNPDVLCPHVTGDSERVEVCEYNRAMVGHPPCGVYGEFETRGGKLVTFDVDRLPISSRVGGVGASATIGPLTASVTSSYRMTPHDVLGDELVVAVSLSTTESTWKTELQFSYYVDPAGRSVVPLGSYRPDGLAGACSGVATVRFPGADPGGILAVDVFESIEDLPPGATGGPMLVLLGQIELGVPAYEPDVSE